MNHEASNEGLVIEIEFRFKETVWKPRNTEIDGDKSEDFSQAISTCTDIEWNLPLTTKITKIFVIEKQLYSEFDPHKLHEKHI